MYVVPLAQSECKYVVENNYYLTLHAELGLFPLCFKAFKLMFRYYIRLIQLEENNDSKYDLLRSAFEEDKQLFNHSTSWVKSVFQMKNIFNLLSLDISYSDFLEKIKLTYINKIMSQLSHHVLKIQKRESFVSLVMYMLV